MSTLDIATDLVTVVLISYGIFVQRREIRSLRRELRSKGQECLTYANNLAYWRGVSADWKRKYHDANKLLIERDPLNLFPKGPSK